MEQHTNADSKFKELFFTTNKTKTKNKLLSLSLFWLGLSVSIIFLITFGLLYLQDVPIIANFISRFLGNPTLTIVLSLVNIALLIGMFFILKKQDSSLLVCISLYLIFTLFEGFYLASLFFIYNVQIREMIPLFLIPSLVFAIMGILGTLNILDFSKILPFLIIATIGLMIFSFVMFFASIFSNISFLYKIYCIIGFIVFSLWIGFDLQMIQRTANFVDTSDKQTFIKLSIMMGLNLFIDFINLLIMTLRLFKN
ncbi:MAG: Bax inhibitor-1/YccA family protein [Metamycoplasmataceae bacterium]